METGLQLLTKSEQEGDGGEKEKKSLGVFWCFKLVIVEKIIPREDLCFVRFSSVLNLLQLKSIPRGGFLLKIWVFLCFVFGVRKKKKKKKPERGFYLVIEVS